MGGLPVEMLQFYREAVARGIHPLDIIPDGTQEEEEEVEESREKILETFDLEGIVRYIADKEVKNIVVMCGAGISTSAGIPDFRTPGTGLYHNLQRFGLPRAESIFELGFFRKKPGAFYELAKEMWPDNFEPTPCHYFIRLLHEKGLLKRCYTQNIDSLESRAGVPSDKIVAAHGNFDAAHVIDKHPEVEVPIEEFKLALDRGEEGWTELREKYGGLVKPKIVFFGENLPRRFFDLHQKDLADCDLLLVFGTSLVVHPFAGLVGLTNPAAPRVLVNREPAGLCESLTKGFRFHKSEEADGNWRDVFFEGDCDGGVRALASFLGWSADLEALVENRGLVDSVQRAPWADVV